MFASGPAAPASSHPPDPREEGCSKEISYRDKGQRAAHKDGEVKVFEWLVPPHRTRKDGCSRQRVPMSTEQGWGAGCQWDLCGSPCAMELLIYSLLVGSIWEAKRVIPRESKMLHISVSAEFFRFP